jgi:hypothetical protein
VRDRGCSGVSGERARKKGKLWRDLDVGTRRERTGTGWRNRKRMCRMCREERETIEHMWRGCGKMRDRMDERGMEEEGKDREEEGWGIE